MNDLALMGWEADAQLAQLSEEGRRKVRARCLAMERILKSKPRGHAIAREAKELGLCGSAVRRLVTLYTRSGGRWQSMIDKRAEPHTDQQLPAAFDDFWKSLCEDNQRASRPAHRVLCRLYWSKATTYTTPKGEVFQLWPGYAERPEPSCTSSKGLPRGWSYANLMLPSHRLSKLEQDLARRGPIAASNLLPMVFTTRRNLKPGQFYVFDDRWNDFKCVVPGRMSKPVRSIELSAGDVFSAKTVTWGLIPLVENEEGKREQIKDVYMRMLLVDLLCQKGFHRAGCTLLVEHGTAAIGPELELVLCALSGGEVRDGKIVRAGLIQVDRSGIKGGKSFAGGFQTLGQGNFRHKAGWESMHNLKHNELANLPGQTGKNSRLEVVEELHGREKAAVKMMLAATETRPEVARALLCNLPFLPFSQLFWAFDRVLRAIENEHEHELEGWTDAGLVTSEFRVDPSAQWQPMAALLKYEPAQRQFMETFIENEAWASRPRKLTRAEAWWRGQRELTRLPMHLAPQIFGEKMAVERPVNEALRFDFDCADIGDDKLRYTAVATSPHGEKIPLQRGKAYRTWINYLDPSVLFVAGLDGNYLGTCDRLESLDRGDDAAFEREAGRAAKLSAEMVEPHYRRALRRSAAITRNNKQTVALLDGGAPTDTSIDDYAPPQFGAMKG